MNVYLVWDGEYENRTVVGTYSTLEAAKASHAEHGDEWDDDIPGQWYCDWTVAERLPDRTPVFFETLDIPVIDGVATLPDGRTVAVADPFKVISVPKIPDGYRPDYGTPAQSCDVEIEERPLL
jgi:hypothetical protein